MSSVEKHLVNKSFIWRQGLSSVDLHSLQKTLSPFSEKDCKMLEALDVSE